MNHISCQTWRINRIIDCLGRCCSWWSTSLRIISWGTISCRCIVIRGILPCLKTHLTHVIPTLAMDTSRVSSWRIPCLSLLYRWWWLWTVPGQMTQYSAPITSNRWSWARSYWAIPHHMAGSTTPMASEGWQRRRWHGTVPYRMARHTTSIARDSRQKAIPFQMAGRATPKTR